MNRADRFYRSLHLLVAHMRAASALPGRWVPMKDSDYVGADELMPFWMKRALVDYARNHGYDGVIMDRCISLKAKHK